jgi:hypothetical protein
MILKEERRPRLSEIKVRWGGSVDRSGIARVLEQNSIPGWIAFEERFIVAEEPGKILAVMRYRAGRKRLLLGPPVVDPRTGEHRFAVALYSAAEALAREMGLREVWADSDDNREYLLDAGYSRQVGGWRLDTMPSLDEYEDYDYEVLPKSGWRRVRFLWGVPNVPFFRAF